MALSSVRSPSGAPFSVGSPYASRFQELLRDLERAGITIDPKQSGGFNPRNIAGTQTPSQHAYGRAIDVNWADNPRGKAAPVGVDDPMGTPIGGTRIPQELGRELAQKHGLRWGGDWSNPDPMHFEVGDGQPVPMAQRGLTSFAGLGGPPPAAQPPQQPPAAPMGPPDMPMFDAADPGSQSGAGWASWAQGLASNPLFMGGLTTLLKGDPAAGVVAASKAGLASTQTDEHRRALRQRRQTEQIWNRAFPNGQPNPEHPLVKGIAPELLATAYGMGPEAGLATLNKLALSTAERRMKAAEVDPIERDLRIAQTEQARAHAGYYGKAGAALETKAGASQQNAATRRIALYGDLVERLGTNPSQEVWDQENQQGGLIHAAFGRPIPFAQAPFFLAQARKGVEGQFNPTPEEEIAGITREDKLRAYKQSKINEMYGVKDSDMLKKGVRLRPDGSVEPVPGGQNTVGDRQARITAKAGMANLEEAEKFFKNPGTFGGGLPGYVTQGAGQITGQGDSGRAFKAARMGVVDLAFALSGKSVSNAERKEFLSLYQPQAFDTQQTQLWKLQRAKSYFQIIIDARERGASDDDVADLMRKAIRDGAQGPGNKPPPNGGWSIKKLD